MKPWKLGMFLIVIGLLFAACGPAAQSEQPGFTAAPSVTPLPSSTATATPIPTLTQTPTITPTPTPAHPLSIAYLFQQSYSGELVVEETLEDEETYTRQIVSYLSEGLKIYALMLVPKGDVPESGWPVIVFNHGYVDPEIYSSTVGYIAYMDAFASNGYIVLRSDYRGHGESEGEPENSYFTQGTTIDVLNAVAAVKQWETADPDRVGMWAHSMGGWITMKAMITDSSIRAGVLWAGVTGSYDDLCVYWFNCENWDDATWAFWVNTPYGEYGLPQEDPVFWEPTSMNNYLSKIEGVVQLHHAPSDAVVPIELSRLTYERLVTAGVTAEIYEYPGDNHNLAQNFDQAMARSLAFFDLYLKGIKRVED